MNITYGQVQEIENGQVTIIKIDGNETVYRLVKKGSDYSLQRKELRSGWTETVKGGWNYGNSTENWVMVGTTQKSGKNAVEQLEMWLERDGIETAFQVR